MIIKIVNEFSDTPGGRKINEGPFSGEQFLKDILLPKYQEAFKKNEKLKIDFDGIYGCAPGWIDEVFGGLVRKLQIKGCLSIIEIISNENPTLEKRIKECIKKAEKNIKYIYKLDKKRKASIPEPLAAPLLKNGLL